MIDLRYTISVRMTALHVSQADLCRATGIYPANLSQYLAGDRDMRGSSVEAIINALGGHAVTWNKHGPRRRRA